MYMHTTATEINILVILAPKYGFPWLNITMQSFTNTLHLSEIQNT